MVKPSDWEPEPSDEDFDRDAFSCFSTGIARNGVSEYDCEGMEPAKHELAHTMIENWFMFESVSCALSKREVKMMLILYQRDTYHDVTEDDGGMPMHPKCFEVFKKASLRKFGKVDIDGLFLLRDVFFSPSAEVGTLKMKANC